MVINTKDNSKMINIMVMEFIHFTIATDLKDSFNMVKDMEKQRLLIQEIQVTRYSKVNIKMIK